MRAADIRSKFLNYFAAHDHRIVESSSLVPHNDPSLLFTNAGMVQFKDVFLGKEHRDYRRAVSTQKCVRAGGKHNDLENVGFTARHHTFFEMLGNFSFGDYFKKDAIHFAWEFVLKELQLPKDRLYVTVFEKDDEAAEIWHRQEGVPKDRIFRMGEKDNFWSMGDTGPCGPCTELFIDRGAQYGCGKSTCTVGCDCDRYMEYWNLVFMQYDRDASGKLTPLPKPSVDTGAGLERITAIMQDAPTNYDTDLFANILQRTAKLAGKTYEPSNPLASSFRVVSDHARAATFLISDGVMPSNEGRGYVLRRILRRAIRYGQKLGFHEPFFNKSCGFVIDQMQDVFLDLPEKRSFISKVVLNEEEQFLRTLETGLAHLDEAIVKMGSHSKLAGDVAFKLYDTFGFPLDLTKVICSERQLSVDEPGFEKAMEQQREQSRKHWKGTGDQSTQAIYHSIQEDLKSRNSLPRFVGYEKFHIGSDQAGSEVVALVVPLEKTLEKVNEYVAGGRGSSDKSAQIEVFFKETCFYPEGGGQAGDHGTISGNGFEATVIDVQKPVGDLIAIKIIPKKGVIKVGGKYEQKVDLTRRQLTARNHTATHLLHWALRETLGDHVKQAGSLVNAEALRFDFSHFAPLSKENISALEDMINEQIWIDASVSKQEMAKDAAIAAGAIAFFGEKYGESVRVVKVGDKSVELCGGTHVDHAGDIHLFKIISEQGIAAGVRRIVAVTSSTAFAHLRERDEETLAVRESLKAATKDEVLQRLEKFTQTEKDLRKQIEKLLSQQASGRVDELLAQATTTKGIRFIGFECPADEQGTKVLRELAEQLRQKATNIVVVLGMKMPEGKAALFSAVGKDAMGVFSAGDIIKEIAPAIEGRGGGKADFAQAGGTKVAGLGQALQLARAYVEGRAT